MGLASGVSLAVGTFVLSLVAILHSRPTLRVGYHRYDNRTGEPSLQ
jgi:hypothetical protein